MLRHLPNALTVSRLLALPVLAYVLFSAEGPTSPTAAFLYAVVALTDLLDGALARRLDAETPFGRIADPFADRLLVILGLVGLIALGRFHPAGPAVLIARDVLSIGGFAALAARGVQIRVDAAGKTSSALAMAATALALLAEGVVIDAIFWVAVGLAMVTFLNYLRTARGALAARGAGGGA